MESAYAIAQGSYVADTAEKVRIRFATKVSVSARKFTVELEAGTAQDDATCP